MGMDAILSVSYLRWVVLWFAQVDGPQTSLLGRLDMVSLLLMIFHTRVLKENQWRECFSALVDSIVFIR